MIDRRKYKTTNRRQKSNNAPILPVYIRAKALNKILNGKHAYQLDADLLKQIPRALTDPVGHLFIRYTAGAEQDGSGA